MPAAPPRAPRPGWYADPRGPHDGTGESADQHRWWDGVAWTAWLSETDTAPMPRGEVARVEPSPVFTQPRTPRVFLAVLVTGAIVVLLVAVSFVGQGLPQESRPFMAALPSPLGAPERVYQEFAYDADERTVTIYERLAFTLPDGVRRLPDVTEINGLLRGAAQAYMAVPGDGGLAATLLVGDIAPDVVVPGDAVATAERFGAHLTERYRQGGGVTAEEVWVEAYAPLPGAARLTARLRYAQAVDDSTADALTVIVVPWEQGPHRGMGVWTTMIPETSPAEVTDVLVHREPVIRLLA